MPREKAYIVNNSSLMKEWDWDENNKRGLDPSKLTRGSGKEASWICSNGHKWKASIYHRASRGQRCPICSNHRILAGYNDLKSQCPDLMSEWDFETNTLDPATVALKSNKVVSWVCPKGHRYKKAIYNFCSKIIIH